MASKELSEKEREQTSPVWTLTLALTPSRSAFCRVRSIVDPENWTGQVVYFMLRKPLSMEIKNEQSTKDPSIGGL